MPVQINEVIVRAVVDPKPAEDKGGALECPPSATGGDADIVEKVLEIIKEKTER
jgi:hypothetical protein